MRELMRKLAERLLGPTIEEHVSGVLEDIDREREEKYHNDRSWGRS